MPCNVISSAPYLSGHGIVLTTSSQQSIFRSVVHDNEGCGYAVVNAVGPYIKANRVRNNKVGLYVKDGKDWTTLRESKIHENEWFGVRLVGTYSSPIRCAAGSSV
jgi:nitrous oxidase accessory protein NosD